MSDFWDRLDPGFLAPIWLAVGALAVIAIVLLEIGAERRRRQALRQFAASHLVTALTASVAPGRRLAKRLLLIAAVALLFIALARPHLFSGWQEQNRTGIDVLIAVDCSRSMLTEDVHPNRLERAKLAIADFADHLPENRLGLIAFAGDAFLQCPLTLDHDAFGEAVRELDTNTIPRPGTDIATAIDEAASALKSQPDNLKFLILVTDGEDLENHALDAARQAAQIGMKIYTIGVGTPMGGLIPLRGDNDAVEYLHDADGQIVQSRLDENMLRQIAEVTGGSYALLGQNGEGLEKVYRDHIATLPKQNLEERREKVAYERFVWPLGLAILLLMAEFLIRERVKPPLPPEAPPARRRGMRPGRELTGLARALVAGLLLLGAGVGAEASSAGTAEQDYKAGKFNDALQNYKDAAANDPNRSDLQYDLGDAAYKAGAYGDAEEAYRRTLQTPDLGLQENSYYNLGNAQFRHGEATEKYDRKKTMEYWQNALNSYSSALKLKEAPDTRHNYEVVKKKLDQLQKEQQQQDQNSSQKQDSKQGQSPNPDNSAKDKGDQGQSPPPPQGEGNKPQNESQNSSSPPQQQGDQAKPDQGQDKSPAGGKDQPQPAKSNGRSEDKEDPGERSRGEAEALLDSLKDDEKHVSAQALNGNNERPNPPPSGKDW